MKNLLAMAILLLASVVVYGQTSVFNGKVVDQSGEPLYGVNVRVLNTPFGTVTGEDGSFTIQNLKGEVKLEFSRIGFEKKLVSVNTDETKVLNITMLVAPFVYKDFEVRATRAGENDPFAVTNINSEELAAKNTGAELPELLKLSPSVVTSTENGLPFGNTKFRIRGSDPSRINVTVDGIPLNEAESQTVFWVNMTDFTESVSDIQIQRGVGASTNGSASFGASVNVQTKGYDADPYGEFSSYAGSFNTFKNSVQANTGLIKDHFVFNARLSALTTDGYVKHTGMNHKSYFFSGGYFSDKTTLRVKVFGNEEHTGISWWGVEPWIMETDRRYNPAGLYTDAQGVEHYYEDQKDNYWQDHIHAHFSQILNTALKLNVALHYTHGKGYYEQFQDDGNWLHDTEYAYYGFPNDIFIHPGSGDTTITSDLTRQKWMKNYFYGGTFSLEYHKKGLNMVFGGSANRYDGDHFGRVLWAEFNPGIPTQYEYYLNKSIKDEQSLYGKATYNFAGSLYGYADVQYRHINYTMDGVNSDPDKPYLDIQKMYNFFNPKAGLVYEKNRHKAFASFGVANREPTRANLKDAVGDPRSVPTPETLYDTELGYQFSSRQFTASANLFYMNYKDQLVPTGEKNSVGYDIMTNVPKSYRAGVELALAYAPVNWFKWEANATFSQNKIIDFVEYNTYYDEYYWNVVDYRGTARGNTDIAYSPNVVAANAFTFYPAKGVTLNLTSKYVGDQYFDNTSQEDAKLDAYMITDFVAGYRLPLKFADYVDIKIMVNNLFNKDYISDAYGGKDMVQVEGSTTDFYEARWTYYFPQAFRNYAVKLVLRF
ncbi:TonB-dependent receptor [Saccharicrinis sp. FJH2]|uniref:TonB-dependent receptor n=1 Tax=Saccharicrinis sp. FJH65 TaxID=3344659 RepID=UPI0035F4E3F8